MKKPSKVILQLKKFSNNYKKLGSVLYYFYRLLKSSYFRTFVNFLFTFVFAFQMQLTDFKTYNIYEKEFYRDKLHILITFVFIILYNWITITIDNYQKYKDRRVKCLKEVINREAVINQTVSRKLNDITRSVCAKAVIIPSKADFSTLSYQDIASLVCHNIYDAIKNSTEKDTHQVSLMHRFKEKKTGREYIKMISYGNSNQISPSIFDKHFYLDSDLSYYHVKIFNDKQNDIHILKNASEIKKEFVYGKKCNDKNIEQYIAIPIFCENEGLVSLLQIEISEKHLLGRTTEEVREFVKPFMAYVHILMVNYYRDELFNVLIKKFDILRKSKERRKSYLEGMGKYEQHYGENNSHIAPRD